MKTWKPNIIKESWLNKNRFYWTAISKVERQKSISEISSVAGKYGTIIAFQRFSDVSMGLTIELELADVNKLYNALKQIVEMDGLAEQVADSNDECNVLLNITFTDATGDLEIEVPAIGD